MTEESPKKTQNRTSRYKNQCDLCTAQFIEEAPLRAHQEKCHFEAVEEIEVLSCQNCSYKTGHAPSLDKHKKGLSCTPDREYFRCKFCDQMLVIENNLKLHYKSYHADKAKVNDLDNGEGFRKLALNCDLCMAQFPRRNLFETHQEMCHFDTLPG